MSKTSYHKYIVFRISSLKLNYWYLPMPFHLNHEKKHKITSAIKIHRDDKRLVSIIFSKKKYVEITNIKYK